jgi:hypothetical protein
MIKVYAKEYADTRRVMSLKPLREPLYEMELTAEGIRKAIETWKSLGWQLDPNIEKLLMEELK